MMTLPSCNVFKQSEKLDTLEFPIKPVLSSYNVPPVIKKVDGYYMVTNELVTNSVVLTDYYKRIEIWKEGRNIR
jgi:hypothetical protein